MSVLLGMRSEVYGGERPAWLLLDPHSAHATAAVSCRWCQHKALFWLARATLPRTRRSF